MRFSHLAAAVPLLTLALSFASYADGLTLGATRLIYPQGKKEASVSLNNSGNTVPYLVQSWVANFKNDNQPVPFVTTPPLFKLAPSGGSTVRVVYTGIGQQSLPADRESVFLLNVRAVPAVAKEASPSRLTIATQNVIKLIYRPTGLTSRGANEAWRQLKLTPGAGGITFTNPTPYVVTLTRMKIDGQPLERPGTLLPFASRRIDVPAKQIRSVTFSTINDFGGMTPGRTESF